MDGKPAKALEELHGKRAAKLKEVEDEINTRLSEPWTQRLSDLVLYKQMNALGIRISDVNGMIEREIKKAVPA